MCRYFISLPREETARGTYPTSKALAYKLSTSKFYKLSFLATLAIFITLIAVSSFSAILICLATALISKSSRNARRLDAYRSTYSTFSATSEYRHIRPTFATTLILATLTVISSFLTTLILDSTSLYSALSLALILISSSLRLALSLLTISLI